MRLTIWRAFLLVMALLLVGAVPALAQSSEEGWLLTNEDDSVLVSIQRDVSVGPGEVADGVVIIDGDALIEGPVQDLFGVDADIVVRGTGANVERMFTIGGSVSVEAGASVGDVTYSGTDVTGVSEAVITGELVNAQEEFVGALAAVVAVLIVVLIFVAIGGVIAMLALTLLVIAFGTEQTRRAAATISHDVLKTIVVGLLMLIVPSLIVGLLFVTIVGIPLAIAVLVLWGLVAFLGQIVVAVWIGERILPRARSAARPYGAAFLGMLILILLWWTGIVPLLSGIFGTGAVTLAGWRVLRSGGRPATPAGWGGQPYGQPVMVAPPPYAPPPYAPPPPGQGQWPPQGGQPPGAWPQS